MKKHILVLAIPLLLAFSAANAKDIVTVNHTKQEMTIWQSVCDTADGGLCTLEVGQTVASYGTITRTVMDNKRLMIVGASIKVDGNEVTLAEPCDTPAAATKVMVHYNYDSKALECFYQN